MNEPSVRPPTRLRRGWLCGLLGLCMLAIPGARAAEPVRVLTEEFPPYNYTEHGRITGLGTELVEAVLQHLGLQGQFQSMPWARAYETAKGTPGVLLYSIRAPRSGRSTSSGWA